MKVIPIAEALPKPTPGSAQFQVLNITRKYESRKAHNSIEINTLCQTLSNAYPAAGKPEPRPSGPG